MKTKSFSKRPFLCVIVTGSVIGVLGYVFGADSGENVSKGQTNVPKAQTALPATGADTPQTRTFLLGDKPADELHYRLVVPDPNAARPERGWPLVVCLHGAGERGVDHERHVGFFKPFFASRAVQTNYPAYVLMPQVPGSELWATYGWGTQVTNMAEKPGRCMRLTRALIDELMRKEPIDPERVYVTGLSMGGYGTWEFIQRWPDLVAAAAPICGGGDPTLAGRVKDIPIWTVHGGKDDIIRPENTTRMVEAIRAVGGNPKYVFLSQAGHGVWAQTYGDPEFLPWMFSQRRVSAKRSTEPGSNR